MAMAIFGNEISIQPAGSNHNPENTGGSRSALQNSDINRAELGALLRRHEKNTPRGARGFWQGFMAAQAASCANSNG